MSMPFALKRCLQALGFSGLVGLASSPENQTSLRIWLLEVHAKQVELLKVDWGQPGLCTEWDRDYDAKTRSCGRRGKLIERKNME